ncbi:MAG: glycosyl hydrolase [Chthoniobacteraceae bacterium]
MTSQVLTPLKATVCLWLSVVLSANVVQCAEPRPISVGAGSYAEFPPTNPGDPDSKKLSEILDKKLTIDESKAGAPIPTNTWWTDLIVSQYSGNLWAHPMVVSSSIDGIKIYSPNQWNASGQDMVLDAPLEIGGSSTKGIQAGTDIVMGDFEGESFGPNWHTTGTAFGNKPAKGSYPGQTAVNGYIGKGLANSCFPNDAAKGTLKSSPFKIERSHIHFLIAGGKSEATLNLKLLINGQPKRVATGDNSEHLKWQSWDVSEFKGLPATLQVEDNADGGWGHILVDQIIQSDSPTPPTWASAKGYMPVDARALNWGDWTLTYRMPHSPEEYMDVTLGHGLPFVWVEFKNVAPVIKAGPGATFYAANGTRLGESAVGDQLYIEYGGHCYGVFAPDNTLFETNGQTLNVKFRGPQQYLITAALPDKTALPFFHRYAFAIPRGSRIDWKYDPDKGEVVTHWTLQTEALKGTSLDTIQGWIPHHYRDTTHNLAFTPFQYLTARGVMKCATGREFEISYPFVGLLPTLPAPKPVSTDIPHGFDENRMHAYVTEASRKTKYGDDTYWGSKDFIDYARYAAIAKEFGYPEFETLKNSARKALSDWYTYTPGEKAHYFAYYPRWKALVGFKASYGSEAFNDQHFHYGYFTVSTAVLGLSDPDFLKEYGDMATLVAKEYANWDRSDTRFPFLRTFDVWEGHSWAGGYSSGNGNNQESSSEAVNSWGGLFLLGSELGNSDMTATGALGWAMETAATRQYWFDYPGYKLGAQAANFSPAYPHKITGILGGGGRAYATYFTGDPGWIFGIQWIPASPILIHLARDPEFAQWQFDQMMADREKSNAKENAKATLRNESRPPKDNTIRSMGNLGGVVLGFTMQFNQQWTAEQFDELWNAPSPNPDKYMGGDIYYFNHSNRMLGNVAWNSHTSIPTSNAYYNPTTQKLTWVIYNPKATNQTATLYTDGKAVDTVTVPARTLFTK